MRRTEKKSVLELFFNEPEGGFHIREMSRRLGLHPNTITNEVKTLVKSGLLVQKKVGNIIHVKANMESSLFHVYKRLDNVMKLYESGLISRLYSAYNAPEAIILFGSYGKGEDTSKSDIDLAVITKRRIKLGLGKYENALKRKIQVFEMETGKVDKNMLTSLANGIVLEGYLSLP